MSSLLQKAEALSGWLNDIRRHLHRNPELSLQEKNTAQYCRKILSELGYEIKDSFGYGFTADLTIAHTTRCIAFRADMDALPIQEDNPQLPFASTTSGVAHLCGHDAHMTIALGTARLLAENKAQLTCSVRFLFQPSEEVPPGGAKGMIEANCLDGVDEVYGLHNDPGTPVGTIRTCVGPLTAIADIFTLKVTGKSCHAARPQDGLDPIFAASQLIQQWQSFVTRHINPQHAAVITVGSFQAGDAPNAIAQTATLQGTVRTFCQTDREKIVELIQQSLHPYQQQGFQCQLNYIRGYDSIVNAQYGVDRLANAAKNILPESAIDTNTTPESWGEDFAYFLQHKPGAFYFLGSGNVEKGITAPLHSAQFQIDEQCLVYGVAVMSALAVTSK